MHTGFQEDAGEEIFHTLPLVKKILRSRFPFLYYGLFPNKLL